MASKGLRRKRKKAVRKQVTRGAAAAKAARVTPAVSGLAATDPRVVIARAGLDRMDRDRLRSETALGWYLALCAPGREAKAEEALMALGFDVYLPRETRWRRPLRGRESRPAPRTEVRSPLFPGYLFVCAGEKAEGLAADVWTASGPELALAWTADGVDGVLSMANGQPWPVRAGLVGVLREGEAAGAFDHTARARRRYERGEPVRIIAGVFADQLAEVTAQADAHGRLPVVVQGGFAVSLQLDLDDVEAA